MARNPAREALTAAVCAVAQSLVEKNPGNTEYERALVDLVSGVLGVDRDEAARRIGSGLS
jgi:hypothetical protein